MPRPTSSQRRARPERGASAAAASARSRFQAKRAAHRATRARSAQMSTRSACRTASAPDTRTAHLHSVPHSADLSRATATRRTSHWGQCGGTGFVGNRCCPSDSSCVVRSLDFSQCVPTKLPEDVVRMSGASFDPDIVSDAACTTGPWTQCGGKYYTGSTCCPKGYSCTYRTEGFSQCARSHSPDD